MSDSTSDTSAIDDKNNETNSSNNSNYFSNVGNFVLTVLILFIITQTYS